MKKTLSLLVAVLICGIAHQASAQQLRIGTVDMKKVFDSYYKTKDAEARLVEARTAAGKELQERTDNYKKLSDEITKLNAEIEKPELSKEAKDSKAKTRDDKIAEIKSMQREIEDFRQTRQRQLEEQQSRMRTGIVEEIQKIIAERVKSDQYDLVLDKSGSTLNGLPVVLFSKDSWDFTSDLVTILNKNKPKEDPSAAPAPAAEKSADSPKPAARSGKKNGSR